MAINNVTQAANNGAMGGLAPSMGYTPQEQQQLQGLSGDDRARMESQMKMQKEQETVSFISNMLKKKNEIAMSIIANLK